MITILSKHTSNRLNYICKHIFSTCLGCKWKITDDTDANDTFIIQYGGSVPHPNASLHIPSTGLVFEKGICDQRITISQWNNLPTIFSSENNALGITSLPFDLFSAAFYLLSRYEEYTSNLSDAHGRYPAEESIAYKNGFLEIPLIDLWCVELKKIILQITPNFIFNSPKYRFVPTIDVDNVFAYKNHGILQTSYCFVRDFIKGQKESAWRRLKTVLRMEPDPFFNLSELVKTHKENKCTPLFFFHCGTFGKRDKRSIFPSLSYLKIRKKISQEYIVGMHPSYHCSLKRVLFKFEKKMMVWHKENCRPIRFHYLRMTLPESYELLIEEGFTSDWSLCYSHLPGFRASSSQPFNFYNLKKEEETSLMIYPTAVMDKTLKSDLGLTTEESLSFIMRMKKQTESVGGMFITLFHNQHFAQGFGWDGWLELYQKVLQKCHP